MKRQEMKKFRALLLKLRAQLAGDVSKLGDHALGRSRQSAAGDLSNMPIHMADIGSDNFEQELTLDLMQSEEAEVKQIDEALARIDDGSFGDCKACGKDIPKARLEVIPFTTMCVDCKKDEEVAAGGQ